MKIADFHIHSKFAGGTSKYLTPKNIAEQAEKKGIDIIGTGDFTHPTWLSTLQTELEEVRELYQYPGFSTKFIPQTEVNTIFEKDEKTHKIHHVLLAPSFEVVEQINQKLSTYGTLDGYANGRPDLHISASMLVEEVKNVSKKTEIIPAHCWTPWYSLFGSKVGFDSVEACYEDQTSQINALETGLSADPVYCRRVSSLDRFQLISCSDAHSPWPKRIGREATVFTFEEPSYSKILAGIRKGKKLWGTFEFQPEEGKYNFNGHRKDRKQHNGKKAFYHPSVTPEKKVCPICGKKLTIGVQDRVYQLADRETAHSQKNFKYFVPLQILLANVLDMGVDTKTVKQKYDSLIEAFDSEYKIWLNKSITKGDLKEATSTVLAEAIIQVRNENFAFWPPGYDGVYGKLRIGKSQEKFPKKVIDGKKTSFEGQQKNKHDKANQTTLSEFTEN